MSVARIWVAGHKGMVGSAVTRYLAGRGDGVLKAGRDVVDLRDQLAVEVWLKQNRPAAVVFAAAKVGLTQVNHFRALTARQSLSGSG
jgi:GDP-L-fucose synthase